MFGKDKVKAHNRLSKSKSGYRVIRVTDFLRKKDKNDHTVRNTVLGVGAIGALGVGTALLLKKKGIKFPGNVKINREKEIANKVDDFISKELKTRQNNIPNTPTPTRTKEEWIRHIEKQKLADKGNITERPGNPITIIEERIGTEPKNPVRSGKDFIAQMDEEWGLTKKKVNDNRSQFPKIEDPWETPILTKIQKNNASEKLMTTSDVPLLTGKKIPAQRNNLLVQNTRLSKRVAKKASSDAVRIGEMEEVYKSMSKDSLPMKVAVKLDHYLKRPRKTSDLGRPPKETSLKEVLDNPNIKKAQEKVTDRLSRAERKLLQKKARLTSKQNSELKKN